MKNYIIALLIISSLVSVSFGLVAMNHMDGQGHGECPFEVSGVTNCVQAQNPIDFATSHLNAFSKFYSATPVNGFSLISLYLLWSLAIFIIFNKELELFKFQPLLARNNPKESFVAPSRIVLTDWLSLHENSPAFIGGR
ncbi:MAG TPA: hypothetical protein VJH71_00710 [Candidatus Paceibacterota bacterium]